MLPFIFLSALVALTTLAFAPPTAPDPQKPLLSPDSVCERAPGEQVTCPGKKKAFSDPCGVCRCYAPEDAKQRAIEQCGMMPAMITYPDNPLKLGHS